MSSPRFKFIAGATAAALLYAGGLFDPLGTRAQEPEGLYGVGVPETFVPRYLAYRAGQLASGSPDVMRIRLGYVKGLSRSFTTMSGEMSVNLNTGSYQISLNGLTPGLLYAVWLVDQVESELIPPQPDTVSRLVTLLATGPLAVVTGLLGLGLPPGMTIDRVVVAPGLLSMGQPLAAGSVNVFQKIFFRRLSLVNDSTDTVLFSETTTPPARASLVPDLAAETEGAGPSSAPMLAFARGPSTFGPVPASNPESEVKLDKLISQGADLFFEKTFQGNGRTCGTCHPASNNFMIDPAFIATLPANDPLFVAEFNPALANLEKPELMRGFGLILENLDGLADPINRFVMRGVPHTLGLQVSLERDTNIVNGPVQMTGWSGDGAPGTGSLREFATGAVTQHFTKSLNRNPGTDFKLPSAHQLDAMEAFQLSLGRSKDFDLIKITFNDQDVVTGQSLFINGKQPPDPNAGGKCAGCHNNAGALLGGKNLNINTNVEDDVTHPARSLEDFPIDGGFGSPPAFPQNPDGSFGNRTFNLASVVEAADTAPFFHNNLANTLEEVVDFYNSDFFNNPRQPAARFDFNTTERGQLVDFMRGINTLQNIDVARRELKEIRDNKKGNPRPETDRRLQTAFEETDDAIRVLDDDLFPSAVTRLLVARNRISQAQLSNDPAQRRSLVQQAITELEAARNAVATETP